MSATWEDAERCFRDGFVPSISTAGLTALAQGLRNDDPRLLQGSTTEPPPMNVTQEWQCKGADPIGYCFMVGEGFETVGEVEEQFAIACHDADVRLGEPAACRHFIQWVDDTPRDEMRATLLPLVESLLQQRLTALPVPDVSPAEVTNYEFNRPLDGIRVLGDAGA